MTKISIGQPDLFFDGLFFNLVFKIFSSYLMCLGNQMSMLPAVGETTLKVNFFKALHYCTQGKWITVVTIEALRKYLTNSFAQV